MPPEELQESSWSSVKVNSKSPSNQKSFQRFIALGDFQISLITGTLNSFFQQLCAEKNFQKKPEAWIEIRFVNVSETSRDEMARLHEDILESAGYKLKD